MISYKSSYNTLTFLCDISYNVQVFKQYTILFCFMKDGIKMNIFNCIVSRVYVCTGNKVLMRILFTCRICLIPYQQEVNKHSYPFPVALYAFYMLHHCIL